MSNYFKLKRSIIMAGISVLAFSCSKELELKLAEPPKEIIVNVEQVIDGELGQYCIASNQRVKISFTKIEEKGMWPFAGYKYQIPVNIDFEVAKTIKAGTGYNHYGPKLEIEFLDKNGQIIKLNQLTISMRTSYEDLASYIKSGKGTKTIMFDSQYTKGTGDIDKSLEHSQIFLSHFSKVAKIRLKSEIIEETFDTNTSSDEESDYDSSGGDCQTFLDEYEEVYLEYVDLAKEMSQDPENTATYSAKSIEISKKMSKIEGDIRKCGDKEIIKKMTEISLKASQKFY